MEYKVNELAKLSGVSSRTLRYYDQIGLLTPERLDTNGYRIYGKMQVERLQQILLYRELGISLEKMSLILNSKEYNVAKSLDQHLTSLQNKKEQIEILIKNVQKTIRSMNEGDIMTDKEKFEGFKQNLIKENYEKYGDEINQKYGKDVVEASNKKLARMTEEQWLQQQKLSEDIFKLLEKAIEIGNPACIEAQEAADLHRKWLCMFWKDGTYSKQAHLALAQGYVADSRFTAFYDEKLGKGAAIFLRDAIEIYVK